MRKFMIGALAVGLVAGALALPATAGKAKPQAITFYLHGPYALGEVDHAETAANTAQGVPDGFQTMDTTEPADPAPDSMGLTNYVRGPNRNCSGNALFPTWTGKLVGKDQGLAVLAAVAAVDEAVIVAQREIHHWPDHHLTVDRHGPVRDLVQAEDANLRRVEDRRAHQRPEHAAVGDGEGAALEIVERQRAEIEADPCHSG